MENYKNAWPTRIDLHVECKNLAQACQESNVEMIQLSRICSPWAKCVRPRAVRACKFHVAKMHVKSKKFFASHYATYGGAWLQNNLWPAAVRQDLVNSLKLSYQSSGGVTSDILRSQIRSENHLCLKSSLSAVLYKQKWKRLSGDILQVLMSMLFFLKSALIVKKNGRIYCGFGCW